MLGTSDFNTIELKLKPKLITMKPHLCFVSGWREGVLIPSYISARGQGVWTTRQSPLMNLSSLATSKRQNSDHCGDFS